MWSKGFPAENARLQGKPFLVYSLPLSEEIGNLFLRIVLGELFALFSPQKFPTEMAVQMEAALFVNQTLRRYNQREQDNLGQITTQYL